MFCNCFRCSGCICNQINGIESTNGLSKCSKCDSILPFYLYFGWRDIPPRRLEKCQRAEIVHETIGEKVCWQIAAHISYETPEPLSTLFGFIAIKTKHWSHRQLFLGLAYSAADSKPIAYNGNVSEWNLRNQKYFN